MQIHRFMATEHAQRARARARAVGSGIYSIQEKDTAWNPEEYMCYTCTLYIYKYIYSKPKPKPEPEPNPKRSADPQLP